MIFYEPGLKYGGFLINKMWGSYSTTIRPKVGANNGKKLQSNQKIFLNTYNNSDIRKLDFINTKINFLFGKQSMHSSKNPYLVTSNIIFAFDILIYAHT